MKLYHIRNWSEWFENNRSKTVKDLSWVAIPNRHDGEHFSAIMLHARGAEIFSAWILMVQVASRCQPRGTLLRDGGQPHDSRSLSIKTRAPVDWFEIALEFIVNHTDWMSCEEYEGQDVKTLTPACQPPATELTPACHGGAQERRKEGNGKEGRDVGVRAVYDLLQGKLNQMYGRPPSQALTGGDMYLLLEISRRPNVLEEFEKLKAFRDAMPERDKQYFPQSLSSLLEKWDSKLDPIRIAEQPRTGPPRLPYKDDGII